MNVVIANTSDSRIESSVIAAAQRTTYKKYTAGDWAPQTWFTQVLQLNLVDPLQRSYIASAQWYMHAWRWNLIPLMLLGLVVAVRAVDEWKNNRTLDVVASSIDDKDAS